MKRAGARRSRSGSSRSRSAWTLKAQPVGALARPRFRPQRLADLVAGDDPAPFADQVLEQLAGALGLPVAADRPGRTLDTEAPQRRDLQVRRAAGLAAPARRRATAAVARLAGAEVEDDPRPPVVEPRRGHPGGALQRAGVDVHPYLRQLAGLGGGALGQAALAEHRLEPVADQLAAAQAGALAAGAPRQQQLAGAAVEVDDVAGAPRQRHPEGEVLQHLRSAELGGGEERTANRFWS